MKATSLRWTLSMAASEFEVDRRTITTRVKAAGILPGEDGKFSSAQINKAIHGDLAGEKLRKLRAEADLAEMERDTLAKNSIPMALIDSMFNRTATGIRAIITRSRLTEQEQDDILSDIRSMIEDLGSQGYAAPESKAAHS